VIVPLALVLFRRVEAGGSVSGTPFVKPSSDTCAAATPDVMTGSSLTGAMRPWR